MSNLAIFKLLSISAHVQLTYAPFCEDQHFQACLLSVIIKTFTKLRFFKITFDIISYFLLYIVYFLSKLTEKNIFSKNSSLKFEKNASF